jgi:hypothetical protein
VALRTMPNLAFIGEEVKQHSRTLEQITQQIADLARRTGLEPDGGCNRG